MLKHRRALTETITGMIEMAKAKITQNFFDRYRDKIAFGNLDDCWIWTGGKTTAGYGTVWAGKPKLAHRLAYEIKHGANTADGFVVRHKCDVRACVNPAHLETGSVADNNRDMIERGRHVAPKGEAHGKSKLTEADVRAIRATYVRRSKVFGRVALAERFGVSGSAIGKIVQGGNWQHVD